MSTGQFMFQVNNAEFTLQKNVPNENSTNLHIQSA